MFDDEDDEWLIPMPQAQMKSVASQAGKSKDADIEEYLSGIKLSDGAATLSKKLAKYAQRRVTRKHRRSLDVVKEESRSRSRSRLSTPNTSTLSSSSSTSTSLEQEAMEQSPRRASAPNNSSWANNLSTMSDLCAGLGLGTHEISTGSIELYSPLPPAPTSTSTPQYVESRPMSASFPELDAYSPIQPNSDDEFVDAEDRFSPEVMEKISMTASFSTIEQLLAQDDDVDGNSCIRPVMTQSLSKVDEEDIVHRVVINNNFETPRNTRSSSVSPRPSQFELNYTTPLAAPMESRGRSNNAFIRGGNERRSLQTPPSGNVRTARSVPRPTVSFSPMSTPSTNGSGRPSRSPRNNMINQSPQSAFTQHSKPTPPPKPVQQATPPQNQSQNGTVHNQAPYSTPRTPYNKLDLHPDLQTLQDITRQQEEALRQDAQRLQQERKHSWQENCPSTSSSVGSLASSKSVDIGALHKTPATASRIPPPSRLPRPTGIPRPAKITPANSSSSVAKSCGSADDECF